MSNTRRPITFAAMSAYWLSMKSAEAWVVRASYSAPREAPGDVAVAEPVEQRPDAVAVVGHEPVQETAAPMIVLPMIPPFVVIVP